MAIKFKALIGFTRMKDDELMVTATTIIDAMTDNVHFEQPTPELAAVQELLEDFLVKLSAARRRGLPEEMALKNEKPPAPDTALSLLQIEPLGSHPATKKSNPFGVAFVCDPAGTIFEKRVNKGNYINTCFIA